MSLTEPTYRPNHGWPPVDPGPGAIVVVAMILAVIGIVAILL